MPLTKHLLRAADFEKRNERPAANNAKNIDRILKESHFFSSGRRTFSGTGRPQRTRFHKKYLGAEEVDSVRSMGLDCGTRMPSRRP